MKSLQDIETTSIGPRWPLPSGRMSAGPTVSGSCVQEQLGCELKVMFDSLTAGPLPDRLVQLAEALEAAFLRGELVAPPTSCRDA